MTSCAAWRVTAWTAVSGRYVTLDQRGCVAFFRDGPGGLAEDRRSHQVEHVEETTGAASRSMAGWPTATSRTGVPRRWACQYGNAMGAQRVTGTDLNVYLSREETERQIPRSLRPSIE